MKQAMKDRATVHKVTYKKQGQGHRQVKATFQSTNTEFKRIKVLKSNNVMMYYQW